MGAAPLVQVTRGVAFFRPRDGGRNLGADGRDNPLGRPVDAGI